MLVLAPTRELARQIADSFETYGCKLRLSVQCVFGGVKINRQIRTLQRGCDVLVATPGRLLDLVEQRAVALDQVEVLVLDEADQMLDLGFIHALRKVQKLVPAERQTLFFSATMPKAISELAAGFLTDPKRVSVTPVASTAERIEQSVLFIGQKQKPALLAHLLKDPSVRRVLVFSRTKHGADRLVRQLGKVDIEAVAIHGNKSQNQRTRALDAFRSGKAWVLIATDIAARGIDIDGWPICPTGLSPRRRSTSRPSLLKSHVAAAEARRPVPEANALAASPGHPAVVVGVGGKAVDRGAAKVAVLRQTDRGPAPWLGRASA